MLDNEPLELTESLYQLKLILPEKDSSEDMFFDAKSEVSLANISDTNTAYGSISSSISDTAVQIFISLKISEVIIDLIDEVKCEHVITASLSRAVTNYQVKKNSNELIGHCQTISIMFRPDLTKERFLEKNLKKICALFRHLGYNFFYVQ